RARAMVLARPALALLPSPEVLGLTIDYRRERQGVTPPMPTVNVLVTMPFSETLLARIRAVAPEIQVARDDADRADYSQVDVLYAMSLPRKVAHAPRLKWVQLH